MRALITGGAGFLGQHIGFELEQAGHEVSVLDLQISRFHDLRFPEIVEERFTEHAEADVCLHLAAKVGRTLPVIIDAVGEPDEDGDIGATGRSQADAPEIDGAVYLRNVPSTLVAGDIVSVHVEDADAHDLYGVISAASAA